VAAAVPPAVPQVCYIVNMALHAKVAQEIVFTYKSGVETVTNMDDKSALFGTSEDDNPFADLEKIKREIKMLLLKILLTSGGEDLPQFFFNVAHMSIKDNASNATSRADPVADYACEEEDGGNDMLYLLKSAMMVRLTLCIISPNRMMWILLTNVTRYSPVLLESGWLYRHAGAPCLREVLAEEEAGAEGEADQISQQESRFVRVQQHQPAEHSVAGQRGGGGDRFGVKLERSKTLTSS